MNVFRPLKNPPPAGNAPAFFPQIRTPRKVRGMLATLAIALALPAFADEPGPGSVDATFNPGIGANDEVSFVLPLSSEQTLIGGWFTSFDGSTHNRVAMLQANGAYEPDFRETIGSGADGPVLAALEQQDGKLILTGAFDQFNGSGNKGGIVRLNPDGSVDETFDPDGGADWVISDLAIQEDGKIVVVGGFTTYAGELRSGIARLNADGSLDTGFAPGTGANQWVYAVEILDDGSILIGGDFTHFNNTIRNRLALVGPQGNLLAGFTPAVNGSVQTLARLGDGRILVGGSFTEISGTSRNRIARLLANGNLDTAFNPEGGADHDVLSIVPAPDGSILIGGTFSTFGGSSAGRIARLQLDGRLDTGFDAGAGANDRVVSVALDGEENVLVAGIFTEINGEPRRRIARLLGGGGGTGYPFWISGFFSPEDQEDPMIGTEAADPDGDGIPNLLEYALDLDPRTPNPGRMPRREITTVNDDDFLAITFRRNGNLPDVAITVEVSSDMENWTADTVQVGDAVPHDDNTETVVYRDTEPMSSFSERFIRVSVTRE
ncbi:MAG: delta-60 repeat domain-containing protein [Opitutales bacterium]